MTLTILELPIVQALTAGRRFCYQFMALSLFFRSRYYQTLPRTGHSHIKHPHLFGQRRIEFFFGDDLMGNTAKFDFQVRLNDPQPECVVLIEQAIIRRVLLIELVIQLRKEHHRKL